MRSRLTETSRREIERYVKDVFTGVDVDAAEIPVLGGPFFVHGRGLQIDELKRRAIAALSAQARFHLDVPWAPPLPLSEGECAWLQQDPHLRLKLLGYYGRSLRQNLWDYDTHPTFPVYARGALDSPFFPGCPKDDPELYAEFPPECLDELDGSLVWRDYGSDSRHHRSRF
jgi:hypothetical protein